MNRKSRKLALKSALSSKFQNKELIVVENLNVESNKTKDLMTIMNNLKINKNALLVTIGENENLVLASRNNEALKTINAEGINVLDVIKYNSLVIDTESVKRIEEVLK